MATSVLEQLDLALTRLRRLWESPAVKQRLFALLGAHVEPSLIRTLRAIEASDPGEAGVGDVAAMIGVDDSTASRMVEQAVSAGAVERSTSPGDRRRSVLQLTARGDALLGDALRARTTLLAEATHDWDESDIATLATLLGRFTTTMTKAGHTE